MATDICLNVLKYSYSLGGQTEQGDGWTHTVASDIFVVLKGQNTHLLDGYLNMRVVQGNRNLQCVDVSDHIEEAERQQKASVVPIPQTQLSISAIAKESAFALRWRLNGQLHRMQLRLKGTVECWHIVHCCRRRGMQITEQGTQRRSSLVQSTNLEYRPRTASTSSAYFASARDGQSSSPPKHRDAIESDSFSQNSQATRGITKRDNINTEQSSHSRNEVRPARLMSRDERTAPRQVMPTRSSTAQMYRPFDAPLDVPPLVPPGLTAHFPPLPLGNSRWDASDGLDNIPAILESLPATGPSTNYKPEQTSSSDTIWSAKLGPKYPPEVEPPAQVPRLFTSSSAYLPDTLEHEIPPRRELPFGNHNELSSAKGRSPEPRIKSSALELPPLPRPTTIKAVPSLLKPMVVKDLPNVPIRLAGGSKKQGAAIRPGTASPAKRAFDKMEGANPRPGTAIGYVHQGAPSTQSNAKSITWQSKPAQGLNTESEPTIERRPLAERSSNSKAPGLERTIEKAGEPISPPDSSPLHPTHRRSDPTITPYAAIADPHHGVIAFGGHSYTAYSEADRQAALETFFIENWENEDFIALTEDVEKCWKRIALGL